ncbi:MAG TPA: hypothetical protein VJ850_04260 [Candidatus Limnocylindrales bacterium]|nr:hypothetical protein [Candidatus Limnocylindrales bacterium]
MLDTQSDRDWLEWIFVKSFVAFPLVSLAWYVVALAANALVHARLGPGFALLFGAMTAPWLFVPSRYRFVQELGCRRAALFWLVPLTLVVLVMALVLLSFAVGSPMV